MVWPTLRFGYRWIVRIGMLAPPWLPVPAPGYGGTEAVIDQLAVGLQAAGHDVVLFTRADSTCAVPRCNSSELPGPEELGQADIALRHALDGYAAFRRLGVDVVHDHTSVGAFVAADFADLPLAVTNHNRFDARANVLFGAVSGRAAVVAISRAQADTARGVRIDRVIHHGVDTDAFPFGAGRGGYLLFLGRMAPEKGVATAARVARRAGRRLLIAAKMWEPRELRYFEEEVQPLLDDDIRYIGQVGHERKLDLLADAEALLNPIAWDEPFGMTMIESLACGTPVLAHPAGASPEIVDHGCTGFLAADEDGLVAAVREIAGLDRAAAREACARRFSTARMVADHVDLYRDLLARNRAAGATTVPASTSAIPTVRRLPLRAGG